MGLYESASVMYMNMPEYFVFSELRMRNKMVRDCCSVPFFLSPPLYFDKFTVYFDISTFPSHKKYISILLAF